MSDSDRRVKLRETVEDLIAHSCEAIAFEGTTAIERHALRSANYELLDYYNKLVKTTDALDKEASTEVVEIRNAAIGLINASMGISSLAYRIMTARKLVLKKQAKIARASRAPKVEKWRGDRQALLLRHLPDAAEAKRHPWKTAESIRDALNADLIRSGRKTGVSTKTIGRWIDEMPET
ncbi:hypothetical protein [Methylobacterium longum]|uniref:Uncharacterized protein n=1 Tax=Methylobacterium longum TaxID=767694 RepID=A0ABT8AXE7_9HYPH|nr:hypothetical protein [Methylobacterium longum]MDN3574287.1 hypothetical protein [Methylobacterium longum]